MKDLDQTFSALSDPIRRAMLERLAEGEATVGELAAPFPISLPAISRHLRVLEAAALIERGPAGPHRKCRILPEALVAAGEWFDIYRQFWIGAFDRLDEHLNRET